MAKRLNGKGKGNRKSKAESMTGAKENETEVRVGELSLGPPVELNAKDFHFHMRAIKAATEKKDSAVNMLRGCMKAAKMVNPHLGDTIKQLIQLERSDDPRTLKEKLEVLGICLKEVGSPVQLTVHDILAGDPMKQAYARGKDDGLNGRTMNSPYPPGTELTEQYVTGWRNGQGSNVGLTEEQTAAAVAGEPAAEVGAGL